MSLEIIKRGPASGTWRQYELQWTEMPLEIAGAGNHISFATDLPIGSAWEVGEVESFIGFDRGDLAEAHVLVYDDQNRALYRRSLHKEASGIYDSYHSAEVLGDGRASLVRVEVGAHPTSGVVKWHCTVTITLYRKEG